MKFRKKASVVDCCNLRCSLVYICTMVTLGLEREKEQRVFERVL